MQRDNYIFDLGQVLLSWNPEEYFTSKFKGQFNHD